MSSFPYPQHLLHKIIEPQWFPHHKKETESLLTELEAAEEAHAQKLNQIVLQMGDQVPDNNNTNNNTNNNDGTTTASTATTTATSTMIGQRPVSVPASRRSRRGGAARTSEDTMTGSSGAAAAAAAAEDNATAAATVAADSSSLNADAPMMPVPSTPSSPSQRFWNRRRSSGRPIQE